MADLWERLAEVVDGVDRERETYTVTHKGRPAVVLVSVDEWGSIHETLFWLSQPGIHEDIAEAEADLASGNTFTSEQVRAHLGLPPQR